MKNKYILVQWPDSQELMDKKGFKSNCFLINCNNGIDIFGSPAYFVDEEWYNEINNID